MCISSAAKFRRAATYDLEGLLCGWLCDRFDRGQAGGLDTLEALFASIPNEAILRAELRRLFGGEG